MTRLAVWTAVLTLTAAAFATSPDPKSLAIPESELAKARELAAQLGDKVFAVREKATRELFKMGRAALPAVEQTLASATDPEVRARCEWLLPRALADDNKARLDTFLADVEGKYDHDLPGWTELARVIGADKPARELFIEMVQQKENADLLAALRSSELLGQRLLARRVELYNRMYGFNPERTRIPPTASELAALVLAEVCNTAELSDRRYYYATFSALQQPGMREALSRGEAFRKLVAHWLDSRTDPAEQTAAMNTAGMLNLKEIPVTTLALRVLSQAEGDKPAAVVAPYTKTQALGILARSGDKAHLGTLRKYFGDEGELVTIRFNNGVNQQIKMKVGDFALAMAVVLIGEQPKDYGFDVQNAAGTMTYHYYNYSFPTDERRHFAHLKWAFRELREKKTP
jgi:hypothetical protein